MVQGSRQTSRAPVTEYVEVCGVRRPSAEELSLICCSSRTHSTDRKPFDTSSALLSVVNNNSDKTVQIRSDHLTPVNVSYLRPPFGHRNGSDTKPTADDISEAVYHRDGR
ncbi:hypothetical protein MTP99_015396 [Tenebrio molitor]|nr:hypothetical protein MTP99_015396 [Tenebrio molitor]CAH1374026.1 unnamed protein product [Tenebrio molitor]